MLERARLILYAAGVVAGVALITSVLVLTMSGMPMPAAIAAAIVPSLVFGFVGLASRFTCRALPLRSSPFWRIVLAHGGAAAAVSGLWILVWQPWLPALTNGAPALAGAFSSAETGTPFFVLGVVLYGIIVTVQYLLLEVEASRQAEQAALRYEMLMREAELKAFKAQIDPHFLFNSLNAVASMCGTRPLEAREMAQRMADFFRQTLRLAALDRITLAQEIDLVSGYLAIEQVRFGDRLGIALNVDEAARERSVPPLLLQPLVENAVRHGIASTVEGGTIELSASVHDGTLRIRIENPADPDRADARGEGIGLQNARGRLAAISGGRAVVTTAESGGRFRVDIELPS